MAFFDFLGNLGQKAQDVAQNIPGADIVDQASQAVGDQAAAVGDATQNIAGSATEQLGNLTDKLPKP